jgi:BirA family transcriptional regulator, biotin operon repressor / biotin---[acetyl-CoA-carboxylase] ligase
MNPTEEWQLNTSRLGKRVLWFDRLDSTNAFALGLKEENDGLVVVAEEQTAGRGQHGRSWSCPAGAGVLMSVLLFPPPRLRRPAILTAWAAVSVCELIQKITGLEARIKWPNDVLMEGRKVCGILIEQARGIVAGIGLNVNQPAEHFAAAGLSNATSLAAAAGQRQMCRDVARELIVELDLEYQRLCQGDIQGLEKRWQRRIGLLGKSVQLETATCSQNGQLREMTFDQLTLRLPDNTCLRLAPEAVKSMRAEGRGARGEGRETRDEGRGTGDEGRGARTESRSQIQP